MGAPWWLASVPSTSPIMPNPPSTSRYWCWRSREVVLDHLEATGEQRRHREQDRRIAVQRGGGVVDDPHPGAIEGDHRGVVGLIEQERLLADARAGLVEDDEVVAAAADHQSPLQQHVDVVGRLALHDQRLVRLERALGHPTREGQQLLHGDTVLPRRVPLDEQHPRRGVELRRIELLTSSMPWKRSTN